MKPYQKELAELLARSGALFFRDGLILKDGRPTPYFVNFGFFRSGRLVFELGRIMADFLMDRGLADSFDVLVGPSYKGSALAVATAAALWGGHGLDKGYDYDRKEAKRHGEASLREAKFVTGALADKSRVLIIDDVVTTMATKFELLSSLTDEATARGHSYYPVGVALFMDRQQTTAVYDAQGQPVPGQKGQDAVANFRATTGLAVHTVLNIRETVDYLYGTREPVSQNGAMAPLADKTVAAFRAYLDVYGV